MFTERQKYLEPQRVWLAVSDRLEAAGLDALGRTVRPVAADYVDFVVDLGDD